MIKHLLSLAVSCGASLAPPVMANDSLLNCDGFYETMRAAPERDLYGHLILYYACDRSLTIKPLQSTDRAYCVETYTQVKTWFVPDVSFDQYKMQTSMERARINQIGFKAFKAWEAENASDASCLREASLMMN